jgi:hypothetical protein
VPFRLYLATGVSNPATAELHSLEAVTFLKADTPASTSVATRFIEGFERLAVAVQLGLFLPAIKRKFVR